MCLSRPSPVKSQGNAHTRVSVYSSWAWIFITSQNTLWSNFTTASNQTKVKHKLNSKLRHLNNLKKPIILCWMQQVTTHRHKLRDTYYDNIASLRNDSLSAGTFMHNAVICKSVIPNKYKLTSQNWRNWPHKQRQINQRKANISEEWRLTLTKSTARGEKSHAYTKMCGYVAINGKIVFPAPQPTCKSRPISQHNILQSYSSTEKLSS